jgi:hypothetical protein
VIPTVNLLPRWQRTRDGARLSRHIRFGNGCWQWTGHKNHGGYGTTSLGAIRHTPAHRAVYLLAIGPVGAELVLDHLCRNRACVNPAHLEPVTNKINLMRGETLPARYAARTHCNKGHPFSEANTATRAARGGSRKCRTCENQWIRESRARARALRRAGVRP